MENMKVSHNKTKPITLFKPKWTFFFLPFLLALAILNLLQSDVEVVTTQQQQRKLEESYFLPPPTKIVKTNAEKKAYASVDTESIDNIDDEQEAKLHEEQIMKNRLSSAAAVNEDLPAQPKLGTSKQSALRNLPKSKHDMKEALPNPKLDEKVNFSTKSAINAAVVEPASGAEIIQGSNSTKKVQNEDHDVEKDEPILFLPNYVDVKSRIEFNDFIGSPESTLLELGANCSCPLLSTDCLHTINCLPEKNKQEEEFTGIALRNFLRKHASFWRRDFDGIYGSPLGMSSQFTTIMVFREWLSKNQLPRGLSNLVENFIDGSKYEYCRSNGLSGRNCFINEFATFEEASVKRDKNTRKSIELEILEDEMLSLQANPNQASPWIYFLAYCHMSRITFNLRKHVLDLYKEHLREVDHSNDSEEPIMPVSLHVRRGDACRHAKDGYEMKASPLDSPPQMTSVRFCYDTSVYVKALQKIQAQSPGKHMVVYMATDHSSSLLEEIKTQSPQFYAKTSWKYLEYSRDLFDYLPKDLDKEAFSIESPENTNKAVLGESALLDIHHLSHGRAFVGHLGSRFGKLGWYQAIARWNSFVPYFTVDGHSTCCDIDEACGRVSEHVVSMENCLAIFYSDVERFNTDQTREDYWKPGVGATHRKIAAEAEKKHRQERVIETSKIANVEWTFLNAVEASWDYKEPMKDEVFSQNKHPLELDDIHDNDKCATKMKEVHVSPISQSVPSQGACDGYEGILHIAHGDEEGASGTIFFQYMVGMLKWAEQHNYLPWVHFNDVSKNVYDGKVHSSGKPVEFQMMNGMKIGWARAPDDPLGYVFPGLPQKRRDTLEKKNFLFKGTGVWNHYFEPVSKFVPGDLSCRDKPLIRMEYDHLVPGLRVHAPWSPHAWRYWMPNHIQRPTQRASQWFSEQRRSAAKTVERYIRFNPDMEQRVTCAHPQFEGSLGMHIQHGGKLPTRKLLATKEFLPFCQAFVDQGGTSIYLATDSSTVWDEIKLNWPSEIVSRIHRQSFVQGLSSNQTAAFDLGISAHRTNLEALTDIRAMSKCKYLLHGWSAMTESVFYLNPSLIDRNIDLEDDSESADKKLKHFRSILKQEQPVQEK